MGSGVSFSAEPFLRKGEASRSEMRLWGSPLMRLSQGAGISRPPAGNGKEKVL